jgi:hypothetical protein
MSRIVTTFQNCKLSRCFKIANKYTRVAKEEGDEESLSLSFNSGTLRPIVVYCSVDETKKVYQNPMLPAYKTTIREWKKSKVRSTTKA